MRYALLVSYDGTNYGGWQIQNNAPTIQAELQAAANDLFGVATAVTASGRTDSGVHAAGQVCHLDATTAIPPQKIAVALNTRLPADISVLASAAAPEGFHSNRSAKKKTYCYRMYFSPCAHPMLNRYAVWAGASANIDKMREACGFYVGEHDFKAYCKSGSSAKTTVRTVFSAVVKQICSPNLTVAELYITGNGFLYNMVRTLAGTVLSYSRGETGKEQVINSLVSGNRDSVGKTMPACGLTLQSVDYGIKIFDF